MARTLEERKANSMEKQGNPIEILQYVTPQEAKKLGYTAVLIPAVGMDQHCRDMADVKAVLDEKNMSGEFMAVRRPDGILRRQAVVTSQTSTDGFKGPVVEENASGEGI